MTTHPRHEPMVTRQPPEPGRPGARWLALAVLCVALLMVNLDNTVLNVALPTLVRDLHATTTGLQWIVDAYVLVFAGLLLVAGSVADRIPPGTLGTRGSELRLSQWRPSQGEAETMDARFMHPAGKNAPAVERIGDGGTRISGGSAALADRACCCTAVAAVRVTMPPVPSRRHRTELLLCGHHYLISRQALAAAGAVVRELPGTPSDISSWIDVGTDLAAAGGTPT